MLGGNIYGSVPIATNIPLGQRVHPQVSISASASVSFMGKNFARAVSIISSLSTFTVVAKNNIRAASNMIQATSLVSGITKITKLFKTIIFRWIT